MTHRLRLTVCVLLALAFFACQSDVYPPKENAHRTVTSTVPDPKVIVFVIDGPRYEDSFGDPLHAHVPDIWSELRPLGTLCSNFRNMGWTNTVPGHTTMLTGVWQYLANDGSQRPQQPTLFEYYRKETGAPPQDAVLIGSKSKLHACAYSLDPAYGATFGALDDVVENLTDVEIYGRLIARLQTDHPHFVMASFPQVDQKGHSGVWSDYIRQIEIVDSLAALTWNHLQSDPEYAGQTYMFITADHGRHDDAHGGFQSHGDTCWGCQQVIFMALGPDIRADYEVTLLYTQRDVCTTVGMLLGVATPQSDGFLIYDLFEPTQTGVGD
jgi:Metalloenzyme superfamily